MSCLSALAIEQELWIKSVGKFFAVSFSQKCFDRRFGNFAHASHNAARFMQAKCIKHLGWHFDVGVDDR